MTNESELSQLLRGAGEGIWDWFVVDERVYYSDVWKKRIVTWDGEELVRVSEWQELIHPEDFAGVMSQIDLCRQGKQDNFSLEYRLRLQDRSYHWIHDRGRIVRRDEQGAPCCMMGVFSEIDEFKAAQTALRQSEEMLREVLMHTAFAVYKRNLLTNHYEYVSPAFFEITGYDAGEVRGLPLENLLAMIHEDDVGGVVQAIEQQIQATGNVCDCLLEYRFRHKNGTYRWIQDQFRVLRSEQGHPLSLIGSVSDISLRKATEQVIRQTEKKFHDLFMQLPLPLSIVNSQSEIVFLNALFLHTFGYSPAEIPTLEAWRARAYPDPVRRQHAE